MARPLHDAGAVRVAGFSCRQLFLLAAGAQDDDVVGNPSGGQVLKTADVWMAPPVAPGAIKERDR
ncbi:hypothetical protein CA236_07435 [Sphingomonas sp. ABOLG]|nr:hypothetical protein CA236_07435 [Sphingomonas sp. ABOLG]